MPEKEPQFFKPEEILEKTPEAEKEKEISLEEKAEAIRNFIEAKCKIGLFLQERAEFLSKLRPPEMRKVIGRKEFSLIYDDISAADAIGREAARNGLKEEEIRSFIKQKGVFFLPKIIRDAEIALERSNAFLLRTLNTSALLGISKSEPGSEAAEIARRVGIGQIKKNWQEGVRDLRQNLKLLKQELGKWQEYSQSKREKEEKPMEIKGFGKFDLPDIKGEEFVKAAAETLPRGLFSTNTKSVEYKDKIKSMPKEYGFSGGVNAEFAGDKFIFYQIPQSPFHKMWKPVEYLSGFPLVLAHEWGHSIDPRCAGQKDLSPGEQFSMIKEWEKIRSEEGEWSSYVKKINNPNEILEELFKSQESFAESVAYCLAGPDIFEYLHPKTYEFLSQWFSKRFPEFNLGENSRASENYNTLISSLPPIFILKNRFWERKKEKVQENYKKI